jgi:hypothetical protein
MGVYARAQKIVERLHLEMPVKITLRDVVSGEPFIVEKANVLAALVVEADDLVLEGQPLAAFFAQAARYAHAAGLEADRAELAYARWKAEKGEELRASREDAGGKKPTKEEIESHYRTSDDYEERALTPRRWKRIADLFGDVRRAFEIKGRVEHDQAVMAAGTERTLRLDDDADRLRDLERWESIEERAIAETRAAKSRGKERKR